MKKFILVTAVSSSTDGPIAGAGIRRLKRGVELSDFIKAYLEEIGVKYTDVSISTSDELTTVLLESTNKFTFPTRVIWNFKIYPEEQVLSAISQLTVDEMKRDIHHIVS